MHLTALFLWTVSTKPKGIEWTWILKSEQQQIHCDDVSPTQCEPSMSLLSFVQPDSVTSAASCHRDALSASTYKSKQRLSTSQAAHFMTRTFFGGGKLKGMHFSCDVNEMGTLLMLGIARVPRTHAELHNSTPRWHSYLWRSADELPPPWQARSAAVIMKPIIDSTDTHAMWQLSGL